MSATVAIRLGNLAQLLHATNRLEEAEPLMRRALEIDEASFAPDHPEVGIRLGNLAKLHLARGELDEAEALVLRAIAIHEASLGPDHPYVATGRSILDAVLRARDGGGAEL